MLRLIYGLLCVGLLTAWAVLAGLVLWVPGKKSEWSGLLTKPTAWQETTLRWSDWATGDGGATPGYLIAGVPLAVATLFLGWAYLKLKKRQKQKAREED
ncbi:MAG: hypothetical protein R3236_03565 [Phycisphaeraceae bacterium]|nr:hypothetical protein [Phycisphaeraceae bacterium]